MGGTPVACGGRFKGLAESQKRPVDGVSLDSLTGTDAAVVRATFINPQVVLNLGHSTPRPGELPRLSSTLDYAAAAGWRLIRLGARRRIILNRFGHLHKSTVNRYRKMRKPLPSEIIKTYQQRGPMRQFRISELTAFHCFRCGQSKKSKLVVTYDDDWNRLLCNGCYGRLLSIYEIKAGTQPDDEKATALAEVLLSLLNKDQVQEAERLYQLAEKRATLLSSAALKFIATAEHISRVLESVPDLDWSAATIGLCKAVETEIVERILIPLSALLKGTNVETDVKDKDLGRVARFFADPNAKPPEMGTFAHFLQTSINSEARRTSSPSVGQLHKLMNLWPNSDWISNTGGLYNALVRLTRDFRNPAAHLNTLTRQDYEKCREFVLGADGILWKLIFATQPHRK